MRIDVYEISRKKMQSTNKPADLIQANLGALTKFPCAHGSIAIFLTEDPNLSASNCLVAESLKHQRGRQS